VATALPVFCGSTCHLSAKQSESPLFDFSGFLAAGIGAVAGLYLLLEGKTVLP